MLAACWPRLRRAVIPTPGADLAARKADRLDLLARMLDLRGDFVTLALSRPLDSTGNDASWDELYEQADALGRQWAASDPKDAHRLLPSLLTGMSDIGECFMDAFAEAQAAVSSE